MFVLQFLSVFLSPMPFLNVKAMVTLRGSLQTFSIFHTNTAQGNELSCNRFFLLYQGSAN